MSQESSSHSNVVEMADAFRNRTDSATNDDAGLISPSETLELVRIFAEIKDPAVRVAALNQLRDLATSQSA